MDKAWSRKTSTSGSRKHRKTLLLHTTSTLLTTLHMCLNLPELVRVLDKWSQPLRFSIIMYSKNVNRKQVIEFIIVIPHSGVEDRTASTFFNFLFFDIPLEILLQFATMAPSATFVDVETVKTKLPHRHLEDQNNHDLVLRTFRVLIADLVQQFNGGHPGYEKVTFVKIKPNSIQWCHGYGGHRYCSLALRNEVFTGVPRLVQS